MASREMGDFAFWLNLGVVGAKAKASAREVVALGRGKASAREGTGGVPGAKFNASKSNGNVFGLTFFSGSPVPSIRSRGNNAGEFSLAAVEVSSMQSARQICKLLFGVVCAFMGEAWLTGPAENELLDMFSRSQLANIASVVIAMIASSWKKVLTFLIEGSFTLHASKPGGGPKMEVLNLGSCSG